MPLWLPEVLVRVDIWAGTRPAPTEYMAKSQYDPQKHHRRSIRLKGHDYGRAGIYCVTLCIQHREYRLGNIAEGMVHLTDAGHMVQRAWEQLPDRFPDMALDSYVVMPNHFHGLVVFAQNAPQPLGSIIGAFKSITTHQYIVGVKESGWPAFDKKVWQRNYYEHIVRDEVSLARIREYIVMNPLRWDADRENLAREHECEIEQWLYEQERAM